MLKSLPCVSVMFRNYVVKRPLLVPSTVFTRYERAISRLKNMSEFFCMYNRKFFRLPLIEDQPAAIRVAVAMAWSVRVKTLPRLKIGCRQRILQYLCE
jgi:hypothetical protein